MHGTTLLRFADWAAGIALTVLLTASYALAGVNPAARLAIDMRPAAPGSTCESLAAAYPDCEAIVTSLSPAGEFEAVLVLYAVTRVRAAELTVRWPDSWSVDSFTSCADFTIGGDVARNPMPVALAWGTVQEVAGTQGIPLGILRGHAPSGGCLEFLNPGPGGETLQVLDADYATDPVVEWFAGCVAEPAAGNPCAFDSVLAASFTGDPREGVAPLAVLFRDTSLGHPTGWSWDFGDGQTSQERNPVHTYAACGSYTVSLAVTNDGGEDETTAPGFVTVADPLAADYLATPASGCIPLPVQFTDTSQGHATSWLWNFGDGTTSTQQHPLHTYHAQGEFRVTLRVGHACGTAFIGRDAAVRTQAPPAAAFTADVRTGCAPSEVAFRDLSAGSPTSWHWDFGDGGTSSEQNPFHAYALPGTYTVSLTATNACSSSVVTAPDYIRLNELVTAAFTVAPDSGCAPLAAQFTDLSTGPIVGWHWDFGDGATSTQQNPSHAYTVRGVYTVKLTLTALCGTQEAVELEAVRVDAPPHADIVQSREAGCVPLGIQFNASGDSVGVSWLWEFGDGGTSTERDPHHVYADSGHFDVTLTATSACGATGVERPGAIHAITGPATAFSAAPRQFCGADTVQFTDLSDSTAVAWAWDFGDGAVSSERNPRHLYAGGGVYSVTLSAVSECGETEVYARDFIRTGVPPQVSFFADLLEVCPGDPVHFYDFTQGDIESWLWEFGDGGTSTERHPAYAYAAPGMYDVLLVVTTACGVSQLARADYIKVYTQEENPCSPVATLLLGPDAVGREDGVLVRWTIQPPSPFTGYFVARAAALAGPWSRLNETAIPDRGAAGARSYEFLDGSARADAARYYRLEAVRGDGSRTDFTIPGAVAAAASAQRFPVLWMGTPSPQPSAGTTRFELGLPAAARAVDLALFDPAGRRVATIYAGTLAEGRQAVVWDGRDESGRAVPAGIYFVRASAAGQSETRKLILAR